MGSFESKIKSYERHYGIHFRSLRRSKKFLILLCSLCVFLVWIIYQLSNSSTHFDDVNDCLSASLDKFSDSLDQMNSAVLISKPNENANKYVPFIGNGYIGINIDSKQGIFGHYNNRLGLNLQLKYNPLTYVYYDSWTKNEAIVIEFDNALVHRIQSYENDDNKCFTIKNTLFTSRLRPSVIIEEINLYNPTREILNLDIIQLGTMDWNSTSLRIETYKNSDYNVNSGIIYHKIDGKEKHVYVSVVSQKLPTTYQLKSHDISARFSVVTVVKYSSVLLNSKLDQKNPILKELEKEAENEFKEILDLGIRKIKQEHLEEWSKLWQSGFSISKSLAPNSLNGNQINSTIYYILSNSALNGNLNDLQLKETFSLDRCYEGFSTLQAAKLWSICKNEHEISELSSLWYLTLLKNGCHNYVNKGVYGILQAIILSIGSLKFSNHHLELNLNPKQIHRNYYFRQIYYRNITKLNINVEINDEDNHAKLIVELIDESNKQDFYACDAGCLDKPIRLESNFKQELPVKLTNPLTAILYITNDEAHIDELQHILHVHEVELAPPQDVHSVALHKHGHLWGGLSIAFWIIFIFLIILFHLFLCKLIYRELCLGNPQQRDSNKYFTRAV